MSVTSVLNIAKNALLAQQTALQVVSNNVANVNTPGYARQEAVLTEERAVMSDLGLFLGNGVSVSTVISHYNGYLEDSIARENTAMEEQKTYEQYFGRIESILDENNTRLTADLVSFFNSWQELSTDPLSSASRMAVVTEGANLANGIRDIYGGLRGIQAEVNSSIAAKVDDINDLLHSIAQLNDRIYASGGDADSNEAVLNERLQLVNKLSGMLDIQYYQDKNLGMTIMTSGGRILIDRENVIELNVESGSSDGSYAVAWNGGSSASVDITNSIQKGSLKALIDLRDNQIDAFIDDINSFAESIIAEVNSFHSAGYDANGGTNIVFFKSAGTDFAQTIDVSDEVKTNPGNVAVTSSAENPSGNDIALAIANLGSSAVTIGGRDTTYVNYSAAIASKIGALAQNAEDLSEYHQALMTSIQKQRDGVSGVSIDEEMSNLIKFQYAYQAAARLLNVADSLMDSLLEISR